MQCLNLKGQSLAESVSGFSCTRNFSMRFTHPRGEQSRECTAKSWTQSASGFLRVKLVTGNPPRFVNVLERCIDRDAPILLDKKRDWKAAKEKGLTE